MSSHQWQSAVLIGLVCVALVVVGALVDPTEPQRDLTNSYDVDTTMCDADFTIFGADSMAIGTLRNTTAERHTYEVFVLFAYDGEGLLSADEVRRSFTLEGGESTEWVIGHLKGGAHNSIRCGGTVSFVDGVDV